MANTYFYHCKFQSLSVADGVYNTAWYQINDKDLNFATKLIIQFARARPQHFSIAGYLIIKLETFVTVSFFFY